MQNKFRDWGDVRLFLAVMREGSTLGASRVLGINQTTVARRIDVLEHALGLTLFEKTTKGARPTSDANCLLEVAESVERYAIEFGELAEKRREAQDRVIRITAVNSAFNERFSDLLSEFQETYGHVRFSLLPSDQSLNIAEGETDVAIRLANPNVELHPDLICRRIFELRVSLFVSRSYAEKRGIPQSLSDLPEHQFLLFGEDLTSHPANLWIQPKIGDEQIAMRCRDILAMATGIRMGAGVGMLPTRFRSSNPDLVQCFELPEGTGSIVWLLANPAAYKRAEIQAFVKFFAPRYAEYYRRS